MGSAYVSGDTVSSDFPTTTQAFDTSYNGSSDAFVVKISVPPTPPSVSCTATPSTLWPPNGKPMLVIVSGNITPGTSPLVSGGARYEVIDEYGRVQPSGSITLGAAGTYSFGVSLIAARNGYDRDGRAYTIIVTGRDQIGNVGSCSVVVTVPHDRGH